MNGPTRERPDRPLARGAICLPAGDVRATVDYFVDRLGFRLVRVSPADDPRAARVVGHGLTLELLPSEASAPLAPGRLRLELDDLEAAGLTAGLETAPNGTQVELVEPADVTVPGGRPSLEVTRDADASAWSRGRADMRYRDLIPSRYGGRYIASRIRIEEGGPVPDRVHFHVLRFQMIYCWRGWVRLVYEDQGPEFVLSAGDLVVQPPRIRHRVLESSDGLEVVELACPAEHDTFFDAELELPTGRDTPGRSWEGQRFVRHLGGETPWAPGPVDGLELQDTEVAAGTGDLLRVQVLRAAVGEFPGLALGHELGLRLVFVVAGTVTLRHGDGSERTLQTGDSCTLPAGGADRLVDRSDDATLLVVDGS